MGYMKQYSVSGDIVVADFQALLALPTPVGGAAAVVVAPVVGTVVSGGIPYTRWRYLTGVGWRLAEKTDLYISNVTSVGLASTSEQVLHGATIRAGLLTRLRYASVNATFGKSANVDAALFCRARLGYSGGISDTSIAAINQMVAGYKAMGVELNFSATSATQIRFNGSQIYYPWVVVSNSALPMTVSGIQDVNASETVLSLSMTMGGTSDVPAVHTVVIAGS